MRSSHRIRQLLDDIEKNHKYKTDNKSQGQSFIITIGEKRWNDIKEKYAG